MGWFPLVKSGGLGLQTNLSAFYSLENTSWTDDVGSNNLTGNGGPTIVTGKVGNGVNFVGSSSQYLSHADTTALNVGGISFSVQAWVNATSSAGSFVSKSDGGFANREYGLQIQFSGGNFWAAALFNTGGTEIDLLSSVAFNSGSWVHLILTYDGTTAKLYVNNNSPSSVAVSSFPVSTSNFWIGRDFNNGFATAVVDQVGIWRNRTLTSTDVANLWNSGNGLSYAGML